MYAEGYGMCDLTNNFSPLSYFDHEFTESGNWMSATIVQPNGPNTFPLQIVRPTSNGIWTLTQTFSRNTAVQTIKVVMQLKNNSATTRTAFLERYADVDADGSRTVNYSDTGRNSAWTYYKDNYGSKGHGLTLRALPDNFTRVGAVIAPNGGNACSRIERTGPYFGDSALDYTWFLGSVAAYATKTVTIEYRTM
jgi:hypothetical protein